MMDFPGKGRACMWHVSTPRKKLCSEDSRDPLVITRNGDRRRRLNYFKNLIRAVTGEAEIW